MSDPLFETELEATRSATEWLREGERLEALGQWKAALRCRYRSLLAELIDRGVVRDLPGRTSGEFRVEVRRRAVTLSAAFDRASDLFDAAWYGDEPTGAEEARVFAGLVLDILRDAPELASELPTAPPDGNDDGPDAGGPTNGRRPVGAGLTAGLADAAGPRPMGPPT